MATLRFDHFITWLDAPNVEQQLDAYRRGGFVPEDTTVRHAPALRNGFISFGPDYLELCCIEDWAAFATTEPLERIRNRFELALRTVQATGQPRPWGIGLASDDVQALREE